MDERNQNHEAMAKVRMLRTSPQKLNLVSKLIRNKSVSAALVELRFSKKRIAIDVRKCLESAIANAENNNGADVDELKIKTIYINKGTVLKRIRAQSKGRAGKIIKPTSHITVIVGS